MSTDEAVLQLVAQLEGELPQLIEQAADPEGVELVALLAVVREARETLQQIERHVEAEAAKAMRDDVVDIPGAFRVERRKPRERKEWQHDDWRRDVRANVLRRHGLLGAQGVVDRNGELLDVSLGELLQQVQDAQGNGAPRVGVLRQLGLDPDDYCSVSAGRASIRLTPLADETQQEGDAA